MFATNPELGGHLLARAHERGIRAAFAVGAMTTARAAGLIPRGAWHRVRTGRGSKGLRHDDWAMLEVTSDDAPGDSRDEGAACCWPAATVIPAPARITGAGRPRRCRWPG